jgi:hypothetical protein
VGTPKKRRRMLVPKNQDKGVVVGGTYSDCSIGRGLRGTNYSMTVSRDSTRSAEGIEELTLMIAASGYATTVYIVIERRREF